MFKKLPVFLCCILLFSAVGCSSVNSSQSQNKTPETGPLQLTETAQLQPPAKGETIAIMKTNMGEIKIKFFPKEAPKAVENFIGLSQKGYYNNLTFHRVMKEFMIQGGDPQGDGTGGQSLWGEEFEDEFSPILRNYRGALSMANAGPNTNGSQFFIVQISQMGEEAKQWMQENQFKNEIIENYMNQGGTPWLDNKHTVFGEVFEGMDVVDKIADVKVNPANDKPLTDVKILSVEITTQS